MERIYRYRYWEIFHEDRRKQVKLFFTKRSETILFRFHAKKEKEQKWDKLKYFVHDTREKLDAWDTRYVGKTGSRAVDPHSFYADPAVFLNADPSTAAFLKQIRIQLKQICKKKSVVEQDKNKLLKSKNHGAGSILLLLLIK